METLWALLLIGLLLSLASLVLLLLSRERKHQKETLALMAEFWQERRDLETSHRKTLSELVTLNRQAQSLLAAKDPLAYQQIEAMALSPGYDAQQQAPYDPSDEAEIARIEARSKRLAEEDYIDPDEQQRILADLTGIDPEFFTDETPRG